MGMTIPVGNYCWSVRRGNHRVVAQGCSFSDLDSVWPCGHSLGSGALLGAPGKWGCTAKNKEGDDLGSYKCLDGLIVKESSPI